MRVTFLPAAGHSPHQSMCLFPDHENPKRGEGRPEMASLTFQEEAGVSTKSLGLPEVSVLTPQRLGGHPLGSSSSRDVFSVG